MTDVVLVQPNYGYQRESGAWGVNPPLGLCYIAAVLEKNNISVKIVDANALNMSPQETQEEILRENPRIVGFSILTPAHSFCIETIKNLNVLKVAGGNQSTALPRELLEQGFDIVVRGEGEQTFLEIVQGKSLDTIKGISYKKNGVVMHNQPQNPLDPNDLPLPARHLLLNNGVDFPYKSAYTKYRPWTGILTTRGCPYNCYFCFKKTFGYKFRQRSVENVMKEVDFLVKEYKIKELDIYDDCFNFNLERAEKILDEIIKRDYKIKIRCTNGLRVDKITERFVSKLKQAGCEYIAFGVESGDQNVLNKIPKAITLDQVRNAVKITKKFGITTTGFFIFGLLGDTKETMEKTIQFAKELDLDISSFTINTPYPGTRLWDTVKREGKLFITDWDDFHHSTGKMIFEHPDVAKPEVVEEFYRRAYKEFYFRPKYILKQLLSIRTFDQFKSMLHGLKAILIASKGGKHKDTVSEPSKV